MRKLFLLLSLLLTTNVNSKVVTVAFGEKLPPYVIPETNSGIEIDIVREALALKGHKLKPVFLPMGRIALDFKSRKVDVVMIDIGEDLSKLGGYYGNAPVLYDNVFITLKKRNLKINRPEDLKGLRINSFIGALRRYPEWLGEVEKTSNYVELNDQSLQPVLLSSERYDIILCDRYIFKYYSHTARNNAFYKELPVEEHEFTIADPLDYRPVFYNKIIRDDFNEGLKEIQKKKRDREIYEKYLD